MFNYFEAAIMLLGGGEEKKHIHFSTELQIVTLAYASLALESFGTGQYNLKAASSTEREWLVY